MAKIDKYEKILLKKTINVIKSCPATFELHWHNQIEIIALPSSVETTVPHAVSINQNIYELLPGDVLLIWGGELHEILANEDNALIGLQFASTIFNELPDFAPFIHIFRTKHLNRQVMSIPVFSLRRFSSQRYFHNEGLSLPAAEPENAPFPVSGRMLL